MEVLFTRGSSLASRLIRRVTGEPVSHCAIHADGWVVHSNFLGLHIEALDKFLDKSEVVYAVQVDTDYSRLFSSYSRYQGAIYDFGALLYLGLRYIIPVLPRGANLWQSTGMFLCTEWITEFLDGRENSSITPYQLFLQLTKGSV